MRRGDAGIALKTVRDLIKGLEERGALRKIGDPLSVDYEVARVLREEEGRRAVLAERPRLRDSSISEFRVVGGIAASRDFLGLALGVEGRRVGREILRAVEERVDPRIVDKSPWDLVVEKPDLRRLPVLRHYSGEPGPYMTGSIVIARDEEGRYSASFHRMLLVGRRRLTLRAVEGRKLHRLIAESEAAGEPLRVSVVFAPEVPVILAAATPEEAFDKLSIAGGLKGSPVELAPCGDAEAPVTSEIVLEGEILPGEREKEGPFYEILGKDVVRMQPVLEVRGLRALERGALYHAILPGGLEHSLLMGLPVEPLIERYASKFARVTGVAMSPAGGGWVEAVIGIEKEADDQPLTVALAAIYAHKSLKRVIVVDSDVDVYNYLEVMRAVVQRADPARDYHVLRGAMSSTLDHSNMRYELIDGKKVLVEGPRSKLVIDATIKGPKELFEKPIIPPPKEILTD